MNEPRWMSRDDVEAIHEMMIDIGGGSHGLRDAALLESALARPQNVYAYGEEDTFQLAASYAEGIARNHPFVDGNKRTAFQTAHQFLRDNGHQLDQAKGVEHAEMMEKLGQGQITREDAAEHLKEHSRPLARERSQDQPNEQEQIKDHAPTEDRSQRRSARDIMQEQRGRDRGR